MKKGYTGFDLRMNGEPALEYQGEYATDVFANKAVSIIKDHDVIKPLFLMISHLAPHAANEGKLLEAPQETINKFRHIADGNRRTYAGEKLLITFFQQKNSLVYKWLCDSY